MAPSIPVRQRSRGVPAATRSNADTASQLHADRALRKTGIRVIGDLPWGSHICIFYETKTDLLDAVASYFEAGLDSNEICVWAISDPIKIEEATSSLRRNIPDFDRHQSDGRIELVEGTEWYLKGGEFDLHRITAGWHTKLNAALARGYEGLRISGNAFWNETEHWQDFCDYEHELDRSLANRKITALCTYSLRASSAIDMLDVARAHQCSIARRNGDWEFLETPDLKRAKQEIRRLNGALDIQSKSFPGHATLTPRERVALAQIVRGLSSKEIARARHQPAYRRIPPDQSAEKNRREKHS